MLAAKGETEVKIPRDPEKVEVAYQTVPDPVEMRDEGTQTELEYTHFDVDEKNLSWDLETER
jgi:hypothetical protein